MPPQLLHVRVLLPRTFVAELAARAAVEKTDINALILRAVRHDLDSSREARRTPLGRRKTVVRKARAARR